MPVRWDWIATGEVTLVHQPATPEPGPWGSRVWTASDLTPSYRWFNGKVLRHLPGDPVVPQKRVDLNLPQGDVGDAGARIYPFLVRTGRQPADAMFQYLATPRWPQNGKEIAWNSALAGGMEQSNLPYSGQHEFVETVWYQGVNHEVPPKDQALSCRDCHAVLAEAPSCGRCHQPKDGWDFEALALKGRTSSHPAQTLQPRIDFRALGYPDDPIRVGGRFTRLPLVMTGPPQAGPMERRPAQGREVK